MKANVTPTGVAIRMTGEVLGDLVHAVEHLGDSEQKELGFAVDAYGETGGFADDAFIGTVRVMELLRNLKALEAQGARSLTAFVEPEEAVVLSCGLRNMAKKRAEFRTRNHLHFSASAVRHLYTANAIEQRLRRWEDEEVDRQEAVDTVALDSMVREWARKNAEETYNYSSRAAWYGKARQAGVITRTEFAAARKAAGELWDYTGD